MKRIFDGINVTDSIRDLLITNNIPSLKTPLTLPRIFILCDISGARTHFIVTSSAAEWMPNGDTFLENTSDWYSTICNHFKIILCIQGIF